MKMITIYGRVGDSTPTNKTGWREVSKDVEESKMLSIAEYVNKEKTLIRAKSHRAAIYLSNHVPPVNGLRDWENQRWLVRK